MDFAPENFIADHVRRIPKSGIRDFFEIVQSMEDVISLGIGEPDFDTPWHIREAAIYALENGRTGYTSNLGLPRLRRSVARYMRRRFDLEYDPRSEIIVTVGVSEAIDLALRALLNPGEEVLYHEPCYVSYLPSIELAHGKPVAISTRAEDDFQLTPSSLARAITPRTKALMLNFPTNPTGAVLDPDQAEDIAALCAEHDLIVLSDEVYAELVYDGRPHQSFASLPGMRERTILLNGLSKGWAMTGFRVGYACAPAALTDAMMKIHQYSILCASNPAQEAAIEALENGDESVQEMRRDYEQRRNLLLRGFKEAGLLCVRPSGAFYLFADIRSTGLDSHTFAMRLLQEKNVAVVPGTAFGKGGAGFIRCSYATGMKELQQALERIREFCHELRVESGGKEISRAA